MISFKYTDNAKDIYSVHDIFYLKVKVEPYKSSVPAQCHSCQHFGHFSLHFGKPPRCVKCGLDRFTKYCAKAKNSSATCCNYNNNHTANYKGCPSYMTLIKEKAANRREPELHNNQPKPKTLFQPIASNTSTQINKINPISYIETTKN